MTANEYEKARDNRRTLADAIRMLMSAVVAEIYGENEYERSVVCNLYIHDALEAVSRLR